MQHEGVQCNLNNDIQIFNKKISAAFC